MATTTAKLPTSGTSVSSAPWLDNTWTTPENITVDDTSYASVTDNSYDTGDQTFILRGTSFDFSAIPAGSTINGVQVIIGNARYATALVSCDLCQLVDNGTPIGSNKYATPQALTTSDANYTVGNSTDVWNASLTATLVKSSTFGVNLGFLAGGNNADVYVEYVTMEVWYTAPPQDILTATAITVGWTAISSVFVSALNSTSVASEWQTTTGTLVDSQPDSVDTTPVAFEWQTVTGTVLEHIVIDATPTPSEWQAGSASFMNYLNTTPQEAVWQITNGSLVNYVNTTPQEAQWQTTTGSFVGIDSVTANPGEVHWTAVQGTLVLSSTAVADDTRANAGSGRAGKKGKKLPYYEGYKDSRIVLDDTHKKITPVVESPAKSIVVDMVKPKTGNPAIFLNDVINNLDISAKSIKIDTTEDNIVKTLRKKRVKDDDEAIRVLLL